ncbi:desmoglein-2-like protein [Polymixia lowei]
MALVCKSSVIFLPFLLSFFHVVAEGGGLVLRRQKREWIIPPRKLHENIDYTGLEYIAKIRSDEEYKSKVTYSLTGFGADKSPIGLFTVNSDTGLVRINGLLDREKIPSYNLLGVAKYNNGTRAEKDIDLLIKVLDANDCPPVFKMEQTGSVNESSAAGTVVMRVTATDADEANTLFSQIYYTIVEKTVSDRMFSINYATGEIMVRQTTIDRETQDTYTLTVKGADMNGAPGGNSGTEEVVIKILDINDNVPTLEKESYEGRVEENTINVEVLRIKAIDLDLMYSDNWLAVFSIVSGNEAGYFSITTDSKTNEGVIMIRKPLDYEELKLLNLAVTVSNKAAYNFGSSFVTITQKTYPITINVVNQIEGPRFQPSVKVVTISEDKATVSIKKVITSYTAIDSDTLKIATNVRYAKIDDVDNWLIIDEKTADIRLTKVPDRESKHLVNGTYYAKIICITNEVPSKTATGTIAIQVKDFNDHCPTLTSTTQTMCQDDNVVYITAVDRDEFPNAAPFGFTVISTSSKEKWTVEHLNGTTAILRDNANLWPGDYKVTLDIQDQQGRSCTDVQVLNVIVCTCNKNAKTCVDHRTGTATFGAPGVLLFLLGLLLLLLVPLLLLFCLCGGMAGSEIFKAIPFEPKEQLISYHTEGQGEDKELPLLQIPVELDHGTVQTVDVNQYEQSGYLGGLGAAAGACGGAMVVDGFTSSSNCNAENIHQYHGFNQASGLKEVGYMGGGTMTGQEHLFSKYDDGIALSEGFLEEYYLSKAYHSAQQSQQRDALLIYNYEGQESPAGSVGCCSLLDNEDDLAFLNDLGPKFSTLAEICQGSTLGTEFAHKGASPHPPEYVFPARPSTSKHTHTHTHISTGTTKNWDHVNVNALSTSNVASGSSTIIQEGTANVPKVHVQDSVVIPNQTLLIKQPVYYTAAPMYVVDPQPQVVVMAGGVQQAVSQVGMGQGFVQVGGLHGSQGMVLVDRQVGVGGGAGHIVTRAGQTIRGGGRISQGVEQAVIGGAECVTMAPGFSQGSISRSTQVLVVENGSGPAGVGSSVGLTQAVAQAGQDASEQGLVKHSFSLGSHSQSDSAGSVEDCGLIATPMVQGRQRVVVQQEISLIEKNI